MPTIKFNHSIFNVENNFMNENNSRKKILFSWKAFLFGILLSMVTFFLLKKYSNSISIVTNITLCFFGLLFLITLILKKLKLIKINKQGYIESPPIIVVLLGRVAAVFFGHGLGFVTFMSFYEIFRS